MDRTPKGYILTISNRRDNACDYNSWFDWHGNVELRQRMAEWSSALQPGERLSFVATYEGDAE